MNKKCAMTMVGGFTVLGVLWGMFMAGCVLCRDGGCSKLFNRGKDLLDKVPDPKA